MEFPNPPTEPASPTIIGSIRSKASRARSETFSLLTTGSSLTQREKDSATAIQSAIRGKQDRQYVDDLKNQDHGFFGFLCGTCGSPRKKPLRRMRQPANTANAAACTPSYRCESSPPCAFHARSQPGFAR